ncbi:STAS domain-containing protein [Allonocardiopsis opalescens]|uniref:STAS domain-containing protein n=1 Tax=Allonocardiopsis opalescens TaxID=1144618 RepID=UPI001473248D|nr:STAS domain-containing protein [Allonocardiopsis opalescens]
MVHLTGEIDISNALEVSTRLVLAANHAAENTIIVDLSGLRFIDSSGVDALDTAARLIRASGGRLTLSRPRPSVRKVLWITGMDKVAPVLPDLPAPREPLEPSTSHGRG